MLYKLLALLCLLLPSAAHAEWHEAASRNFIVFSEGSADDAREFAAKLERFHFALRTFHRVTAPPPANRLRVFLLRNGGDVAELAGSPASSIVGYYVADARGLMLVGTRSRASNRSADIRTARNDAPLDSETILLHEYAHHFMYHYFPAAYPTWYSEGFAEFWGATRLLPNDVIDVGLPANHRFLTFRELGWLPLERLLGAHNYAELGGAGVFLLYAEGWLLMRYVFEHPERHRQVQRYLALINSGASYEEAARQAIPDLERFNSELYDYAGTRRFNYIRLPFRTIDVGPIEMRTPGPAEQALMRQEIRLSQGIPNREAAGFAREVRDLAARFAGDSFALRVLMEAEWRPGDRAAPRAPADTLLRLDPNHARALAISGRVRTAALRAAGSSDGAAWNAARQPIARAVRAAPNDPIVLEAYYDSFIDQGLLPPEAAQNALYSAMELAPSDGELRYKLARDFETRAMIPEAIAIIRPEAFATPHRGDEAESERRERERREERWREAGRVRHESAREMLSRLEARLRPEAQ
ncbi:MAG: hypothetical protein ACXWU2_03115 [Allosphingosinicella sp.]